METQKANRLMKTIGSMAIVILLASTMIPIASAIEMKTISVPWRFDLPHETWNGEPVILKATVRAGTPPQTYTWSFGDGSPDDTGTVSNRRSLEAIHTYPNSSDGTPYTATISVTDSTGATSSDTYNIIVKTKTIDVRTDKAIDDGLWYLHKTQTRYTDAGIRYGKWGGGGNEVGYTGEAVEAFENQGHLPSGNPDEDPYVETVNMSLNYILSQMSGIPIGVQPAGNPDSNGNGIGIGPITGWEIMYQQPIALMALTASLDPTRVAEVGQSDVKGRTYHDIAQDMVDYIAWAQNEASSVRDGIYVYNLTTGSKTLVVQGRDMWSPDISGDKVVWMDYSALQYDIRMYDITTGTERNITNDVYYQGEPAISGDKIVWTDNRNGNYDIYMYNLTTNTETQITSDWNNPYNPAISGDKIVWVDWRYGNADIFMYDLVTNTETRITTNRNNQDSPAISGSKIVWTDYRNGNADIYMYDLATNAETRITTDGRYQYNPSISGDIIVWTDFRNGNGDIYSYNIDTGIETQITNDPVFQQAADIDGSNVVYEGYQLGSSDIYLYDLLTNNETTIDTDSGNQYTPGISDNLITWISQTVSGARGGWRYGPNYGSSDNSVTQWPVIALQAAKKNFGISAPIWVGTELEQWLNYSQNKNADINYGGFGYDSPTNWVNFGKTGAGIAGLSYVGAPSSDQRILDALGYLNNHWNDTGSDGNLGGYYAMYATMKGMRTANPQITTIGSIDWYGKYARYLVNNQQEDGSWPASTYGDTRMDTAWAILILTPTVVSPPPVADASASPTEVNIGTSVTFGHGNSYHLDPSRNIVLYEWDFDGDGIYDYSTADKNAEPTHVYSPDVSELPKIYSAALRVTDDGTPAQSDLDTVQITVQSGNVAPVADPNGPYTGSIGSPVTLDGSASYDPNEGPPLNDNIVSYNWELDGNYDFDDATGETTQLTWNTAGTYNIGLIVTDSFGLSDTKWTTVEISDAPPNVLPVAEAGGPYIVDEGTPITIDATGSYDPSGGTLTYAWNFSNGSIYDIPGFSVVRTPRDGPRTRIIGLQVINGQDKVGTDTAIWTVNNVNPVVNAGPDQTINEGDTANFAASFSDVQPDMNESTAQINYGDGTTDNVVANPDGTISGSHKYVDNGEYTVTVTVTDKDGGIGSDTLTVTVNNVAPTIDSLSADPYLTQVGTVITGTGIFHDPGILDTFTTIWNWDDGTNTTNLPAGSVSTTDSHTYTIPGVYSTSLQVTDKDGGSDIENMSQYIVIYDPDGGFVTGGGWIDSPAGAYIASPTLIGRANFGFVSKYKQGATTPTGETEFQFKVADLNFHSISYEWLVVAGARAQYKGSGTINGAGDYGFMLTAIDGQINGGGGTDKFRIKIWEKATENIVYDNQNGAVDDTDPTTVIAGGSIVIHK